MAPLIPQHRMKLNPETAPVSVQELYTHLIGCSTVNVTVQGDKAIGIRYDASSDDAFYFIEVTTKGSKLVSASHLDTICFDVVLSLDFISGWIRVVQLDDSGNPLGNVFISPEGARFSISKAGVVLVSMGDVHCRNVEIGSNIIPFIPG